MVLQRVGAVRVPTALAAELVFISPTMIRPSKTTHSWNPVSMDAVERGHAHSTNRPDFAKERI